ncbi:ABC transporter ATP-binding protein [Candidatus Bipolaricaulota bacterium]|nr:ABC transporter ATP-binding protein [Candidatus Bipolaricaulota bacterium]
MRAAREWKTLLALGVLSFAGIGLGALSPLLIRRFVDGLGVGSFQPQLVVGLLLVVVTSKALETYLRYYFEVSYNRVAKSFIGELYGHLQTVRLTELKKHTTGEYLSRILDHTQYLGRGIVVLYPMLVVNFLQASVTATVLFLLEWRLAVLTVGVLPVSFFCVRWLNGRQRMAWDTEREGWERAVESLREKIDGLRIIKAFNRGRFFTLGFQQDVSRWFHSVRRTAVYSQLTEAALSRATEVLAILLLIVGAGFALRGWTSVGSVIAFFWYVGNLYGPIQGLVAWNNSKQQIIPVGKRLLSLLALPPEEERPGLPFSASPTVAFRNISAGYDTKEVLFGVTLDCGPGKMTAIVGESGSGKSTLVSLLLGFNQPTQGGILIDGRPIQEYGTRDLREGIVFSSAEGFLFNMTVRDNIALGGEYTADEIVEAAKVAGIHEFIMSLPQGYDTVVGEKGAKLSDGERQRIALARAVIRKPKILILDEATSGVDSKTEAQIYERLRDLGATLVVVAHRLSTIHMADQMYLLERGSVVCQGRHEELLARCPAYRALFEKQLVHERRAAPEASPPTEG